MIDGYARVLTILAALGAGLGAGVFFAFSTFVMKALGRLPDRQGLTAMQSINKAAPSGLFMLALMGTAVVCLALGITSLRRLDEPAAAYQLVGAALYIAAIVVTIVYHIPRNDALNAVSPDSASAADAWRRYLPGWTAWNHVRTLASLGSATALTLALRV